jgi:hypothetical protein
VERLSINVPSLAETPKSAKKKKNKKKRKKLNVAMHQCRGHVFCALFLYSSLTKLNITLGVQQHVAALDVSVNQVSRMEMTKSSQHFTADVAYLLFSERATSGLSQKQ